MQKFRYGIKKGNGVPTIPVSSNHQNGDWIATDIYEGEMYLDLDTGLTYTRKGTEIINVSKSFSITSSVYNVAETSPTNVFTDFTTGTLTMPTTVDGDEIKITAVYQNTTAPASNGFGVYFYFNNEAYVHPSATTPTYANSFFQLPFNRLRLWVEITVHRMDSMNAYIICKQVLSNNSTLTPTTYGEEAYAQISLDWDSVTNIIAQTFITGGGEITLEYLKITKLSQ